ncbi:MAG TPA: metallophosphoesterase [Sandaracinaceae bacterium]
MRPVEAALAALAALGRAALVAVLLPIAAGCASDVCLPESAWSLVVLPDTQDYARSYPDIFLAQTRWIADQVECRNIRAVVHVGDIVYDNDDAQWEVARRAFDLLEGRVPYLLVPGNHDYGTGGSADTRDTLLHAYFPPGSGATGLEGGLFDPERADNGFRIVPTPDGPHLLLGLEFGPRPAVVEWADEVLAAHRELPTILVTHAYLYADGTRYDIASRPDQRWSPHHYGLARLDGGVNDGEALFRALVRRHDQIDYVFCGHVLDDGVARLTSEQDGGGLVHEVLANYQEPIRPRGGEGYLRIVTFEEDLARVETYSPFLDRYLDDEEQAFALPRP